MEGHSLVRTRLKRMPDVVTILNKNGSNVTLVSEGMLKCRCKSCDTTFYMSSDMAQVCPCCIGREIEKVWTRPQTLLVPENELPIAKAAAKNSARGR